MRPKTKEELIKIIIQTIKKEGLECDLNFIDTSLITNMNRLFKGTNFNGDISNWNVSNVRDMCGMFESVSKFNGNISKWNVSKVKDMSFMFGNCSLENNPPKWYKE